MEGLKRIQTNSLNRTRAISLPEEKRKSKVRSKSINYGKMFRNFAIVNTCLIVLLIVLLSVGYTDLLSISSNNSILESKNNELSVEVSSLKEIVAPFNSDKRIESIAKSRLDMVYPSSEDIAKVEENNEEKLISINDFTVDSQENNSNSIFTVLTNFFR
ncbi:hypothetical protein HMPREF9709_00923 [Helcococcus kunzii ATCC 51366]|uniref:Cell division protein FtsL n=1 Tax=Helcococcus kunzii ATCC 51366 TaxID=883114 RepID=H3NNL2_9FIRM|nr:hypothetical protein [Helcococcus kunzii]EHR33987.1 hypothetical protein HMPREF9709_00923 [Helcococcus kunzii ATCC 51366]